MSHKKTIVFVPLRRFAVDLHVATARYFAEKGGYVCHFLLVKQGEEAVVERALVDEVTAAGFTCTPLAPVREPRAEDDGARPFVARRFRTVATTMRAVTQGLRGAPVGRRGRRLLGGALDGMAGLYGAARQAKSLRAMKQRAAVALHGLDVHCAIVADDRVRWMLPVVAALRDERIPTVLLLAADSSPAGSAWNRRERAELTAGLAHRGTAGDAGPWLAVLNRLVARCLPRQTYAAPWGRVLFYPALQTLVLRAVGMLPRAPWYPGSTFCRAVVVSAVDEAAMLMDGGLAAEMVLMYGHHDHDCLYEHWLGRDVVRSCIARAYGFRARHPLAVVAVPPMWEHDLVTEAAHWDGVRAIFDAVCEEGRDVLVSLHPRMDRTRYAWLETRYPVRLCVEPLREVLAAADVFVGAYSSTLKWAIGLGIPTVNADMWGLSLDFGRGLSGLRTVSSPAALVSAVADALRAPDTYFPCGRAYEPGRHNGVAVDGGAKQRLLGYVETLASPVGKEKS